MVEFVLYGGKGGVGKTTCAAAHGLKLAREGTRTLVVSTDPAHSLSDVFETDLGGDPTEVRDDLWAVEIGPERQREKYREMMATLAGEFRDVGLRIDEEDVEDLFAAGMAPGSDEVAAMDTFVEYAESGEWEAVVLDTAPTGHTLRLLELPDVVGTTMEKTQKVRGQVRSLADSARSMVWGPAYYAFGRGSDDEDEFADMRDRMERVAELLRDPEQTEFRVVLVPETMAIRETERLVERLREFEVPVETLVVNKVLRDVDERCDRCRARRDAHEEHLAEIRRLFPDLDVQEVPSLVGEVHGLESLETVADHLRV